MGSIPGLGRSPEGGNGNPPQYLSWEIPWTEEPGGLPSMGLQRAGLTYHVSLGHMQNLSALKETWGRKKNHIKEYFYLLLAM